VKVKGEWKVKGKGSSPGDIGEGASTCRVKNTADERTTQKAGVMGRRAPQQRFSLSSKS